jgi:hypothetical protein
LKRKNDMKNSFGTLKGIPVYKVDSKIALCGYI